MFWVPAGFAHGFCALSDTADMSYKVTDYWSPQYERTLLWSDPELGIRWPVVGEPVLSKKDIEGVPLRRAEVYQ